MKSITENTTISITALSLLAGGIIWLSTLYSDVKVQGSQINKLEINQADMAKDLKELLENTYQIKAELNKINK